MKHAHCCQRGCAAPATVLVVWLWSDSWPMCAEHAEMRRKTGLSMSDHIVPIEEKREATPQVTAVTLFWIGGAALGLAAWALS